MSSIIVTPGVIQDMADQVHGDAERLNEDIFNSNAAYDFKSQWLSWWQDWSAFYVHISGDYFSRWTGGTATQIETYQAKLVEWQNKFRALGGSVTGPGVTPPDPPNLPAGQITIVVAALAVLALVLAFRR